MTIYAYGGKDTTGAAGVLQDLDQAWMRDHLGLQFPSGAIDDDNTATALRVYADGTGQFARVHAGSGVISGFPFAEDGASTIPVLPNAASNPRLDLLVARWSAAGGGSIAYAAVQGIPATTPTLPVVTWTSTVREVALGSARVEAGAFTTGNSVQVLSADKVTPTVFAYPSAGRRGRGVLGFASMTANSADPPAAGNTGTEFLLPALKVGPVFLPTQRLIKGWLKLDISGSVDGLRVAAKVRCNSGSAIGAVATSDPEIAGGAEHARVVGSFTTRPVTLAIPFHHVAAAGWHTWQASFFQDSSTADYAYVIASAAQPSQLLIEDARAT